MALSDSAMKFIYVVLGLALGIACLSALMPTIDDSFTNFLGNVSGSTNFASYSGLTNILPLIFIVGLIISIIALILKKRNE